MIQLSAKQKKLLHWVGYPVLALVSFLFALSYTFPYDKLQDKIIEVAASKYDVAIGDIHSTLLPGGIVMESVTLTSRPEKADDVAAILFFDRIEADIGLFALIRGKLDVDIEAETSGGSLVASVQYSKSGLEAEAEAENFPLGNIPGVVESAGMPMAGGLNAKLELELPKNKFADAKGFFDFKCTGCTVGDGVTKVKARATDKQIAKWKRQGRWEQKKVLLDQGMVVPQLSLGAAQGRVDIKKGVGTLVGIQALSADGEVELTGKVDFSDPLAKSTMKACIRWKLSDDVKKRQKDFANVEFIFADKKDDKGYVSFPMEGTFSVLRWRTKRKCAKPGEDDRPKIKKAPRTSRSPRTPVGTPKTRRAASKNANEPEADGPGNSGPKLATPPSAVGKPGKDVAKKEREKADPLEPSGSGRKSRSGDKDNDPNDDGDDYEYDDDNKGGDRDGDDDDDRGDDGDEGGDDPAGD